MINTFNVSGVGALPLILGTISGYPAGAKILVEFRKENICSKLDCERLLAYTNNSSPLFIIGTVGTTMFLNKDIGLLLFFIHIISTLSVGLIFKQYKKNEKRDSSTYSEISFSNFSYILSESILSSLKTLAVILGYIILFSLIINIIDSSNILFFLKISPYYEYLRGIIFGLLEITSGINIISSIKTKSLFIQLILTSFILGVGGISVFMQIYSIISESDLSIKPYIIGKLLHGLFSVIYLILFLKFFPIFSFSI